MNISSHLQSLGLNEKQAAVYLALLELGQSGATDISRQSKIKRSTVYVIIDELVDLGLAKNIPGETSNTYAALEPSAIGNRILEQENTFRQIKPVLDALYEKKGNAPKINIHTGKKELIRIYESAFMENDRIDFFGVDIEQYYDLMPLELTKHFLQNIHTGTVRVREILSLTPFNYQFAKENYQRFHKIRLTTDHAFHGDNALFGNTLLITSFDEPFAVTIESPAVYRTYQSLFEIAWNAAKPPREITQQMLQDSEKQDNA